MLDYIKIKLNYLKGISIHILGPSEVSFSEEDP